MADALKTFFSPLLVRRLAAAAARVHPAFPSRAFTRDACRGLDALELLDRDTTRIPRPGPHAVDVLLNGVAIRAGSFVVLPARRG